MIGLAVYAPEDVIKGGDRGNASVNCAAGPQRRNADAQTPAQEYTLLRNVFSAQLGSRRVLPVDASMGQLHHPLVHEGIHAGLVVVTP